MTFGDVNETVTAKDVSNLRSTPYTGDEGNVVGQLKNGETLVRTGRNDSTGWPDGLCSISISDHGSYL